MAHIAGRCDAVDEHPEVARVQVAHGVCHRSKPNACARCRVHRRASHIRPRRDDRRNNLVNTSVYTHTPNRPIDTTHHENEGHKRERRHAPAKPDDLSIRDEDDRQVLEDSVHWDAEELQALGAGVDDEHEHEADREPHLRVLHVKVPEGDDAHAFDTVDDGAADGALDAKEEEVHAEVRAGYDELRGCVRLWPELEEYNRGFG